MRRGKKAVELGELKPWDPGDWKDGLTTEEVAEIEAALDRTIFVSYLRATDQQRWTAQVLSRRANGLTAQGATIKAARRRLRTAIEAALGPRAAAESGTCWDEMMPAGAEQEEEEVARRQNRRARQIAAMKRTRR